MAVDLGADMLGEIFIFVVGVGIIYLEYRRQNNKEAAHESTQDIHLRSLEANVSELGLKIEEQNAQIRELQRRVLNNIQPKRLPAKIKDSKTGTILDVTS